MAMKSGGDHDDVISEIDVVPLVDIILVVLIVFIIGHADDHEAEYSGQFA